MDQFVFFLTGRKICNSAGKPPCVKNTLSSPVITSFRAVSYITGKELWKLNSKRTECYSRDVDGSALVLNDTAYIGLENGIFTVFNPDFHLAQLKNGILQPQILEEHKLYNPVDVTLHQNNIVTESSPCLLNDHIYITAGSGHLYGYNLKTRNIDWDLYVGSDIDGSPVATSDNCIIFTIEKQYIKGDGGTMKVDPSKKPEESVIWYFPTQSTTFALWEGGIIGSASITDYYNKSGKDNLAAFSAIDGYLYVVDHQKIKPVELATGPDGITKYPKPELVYKYKTGPSISTPLLVENRLVAAGYSGIYLFSFDENYTFNLLDKKDIGSVESTPSVYNGRIYIASRNGYLYCFGDK